MKKNLFVLMVVLFVTVFTTVMVDAQGPKPGTRAPQALAGTAFTYQGQLKNSSAAVNGTCDFQFSLWDDASVGAQVGATQTVSGLAVSNGLFTTPIDFGVGAFTGDARWLNIAVRCPAGSGNYTPLTPRQALTPAPMAFTLPGLYTQQNATSPNIIGGYSGNVISPTVVGATISGGGAVTGISYPKCVVPPCINRITDHYGTIGGGYGNQAGNSNDVIFSPFATVGGGSKNTAGGDHNTIGGGTSNTTSSNYSTIGGGSQNTASGSASTVAGGGSNNATTGYATVGGGSQNTASGMYATVPGGFNNVAQGMFSFATGRQAKANAQGTFVWADSSPLDFTATVTDSFTIRASGGITMYTNSALSAGVRVVPGSGSWSSVSDKNLKANFTNTNGRAVLDALANVPIQSWNYKSQDTTIRHIGPMAQDFYAAFNVGEDDTHIATIDADGVALAAIQGLHQENQELKSQISSLESRLAALEQGTQVSNPINSNNLAMIVIGALLGIVVAQRMGHRGER
jgi:hypothetical protein